MAPCEWEVFDSIPAKIWRGQLSSFWPSVPTALKVVQKKFQIRRRDFLQLFLTDFSEIIIILYIFVTFSQKVFESGEALVYYSTITEKTSSGENWDI